MAAGLLSPMAAATTVRVLPCPFEVVPLAEVFWWHPLYRSKPAPARPRRP